METWSGRLIRAHASSVDTHAAVIKAFTRTIDDALGGGVAKPKQDFLVHRAAQAILYLQGELAPAHEAAYKAIDPGLQNFLWDDL